MLIKYTLVNLKGNRPSEEMPRNKFLQRKYVFLIQYYFKEVVQ